MGTNNEQHPAGESTEPLSSTKSNRKHRPFLGDPSTSASHISSAGNQTNFVSNALVDDVGDITISDATLDAAGNATHSLERFTPPPRNSALSTKPSSTPFSKNVSGNAYNDRVRDELYPLLGNDIKNPMPLAFGHFLEDVFQFKAQAAIDLDAICKETRDKLDAFKASLKNAEAARYKPFTLLVNHILVAIARQQHVEPSIFARPHDKFVVRSSSGAARQPDVVFSSKSERAQSSPLHWSDVKMALEFKVKPGSDHTGPFSKSREGSDSARPARQSATSSATSNTSTGSKRRRDLLPSDDMPNKFSRTTSSDANSVELQLASYALESFAHGPYRSHVVHGMVLGSMLHLWYYDRVGVVKSDGVDFLKEPLALVQFLMSISCLTDEAWGVHPAIQYPLRTVALPTRSLRPRAPSKPLHSHDHTDTSSDDAKEDSPTDGDYQPDPNPLPDPVDPFVDATITVAGRSFNLGASLFRQYALIGRGTCVVVTADGTMVVKLSWPDETRTPESTFLFEAYKRAGEYDNGKYLSMTEHLPTVVVSEDFDTPCMPRCRTRAVPQGSQAPWVALRVLRVTVYMKLLPMTHIRTADDFQKVMRDIARCHRWLYRVVGILHRDISLHNIMFCHVDSRIVGVLIDFDLAEDITKKTHSMFDRTGIPLYMAIDLLGDGPTPHFSRHDLESILWVTVWFTYRYENGQETPSGSGRPLDDWFTKSRVLRGLKLGFLTDPDGRPTAPFQSLYRLWIKPLALLFHDGIRALRDYQDEMKDFWKGGHQGPKPVFGPNQFFYDDTTAWTAFWRILSPGDPVDYDDVCDSTKLGFVPIET